MASGVYNVFKKGLINGTMDSPAQTFGCALMDSNHVFTAHSVAYEAASGNEISGTGYVATGNLCIATISGGAANSTVAIDLSNVSWSSATFTANHAVVYCITSENALVCSIDFGAAKEVSSGTFTIQWNAQGVVTVT